MLLRNLRVAYVNFTKYYLKTMSITVKIFTNRAVKELLKICGTKIYKHLVNLVYMKKAKNLTVRQIVKFCTAKYCYEIYG